MTSPIAPSCPWRSWEGDGARLRCKGWTVVPRGPWRLARPSRRRPR
ncbi:hypothetical protein PAI11_11350 [Patulibacter medicamentivorans]|uniref:Uncharacterized protein n=1 Tax=Patulibacter medicamentivorans TaxID=1097667 RepID=H0E2X0_9ACTN|nr:hypothetical protein PAI11_11350 [Patulibacter medicamentivorans]